MIPQSVAEKLREQEIENGEPIREIDDAIIELFNGDGRAGQFGGVKFLAEDDGEYEESYAYATKQAFENSGKKTGWYVEEYNSPANPDYGKPSP
jgi:hypothetical protein